MTGCIRHRGHAAHDGEGPAQGLPAAREGTAERPHEQDFPYLAHGVKPVTVTRLPLVATAAPLPVACVSFGM